MDNGAKGPITKEQINDAIAKGLEKGAQKAASKGMPIEQARAQALERLTEWASMLAEPDRLTPVREEKSKKEALLEEIKAVACGLVESKWPGTKEDFHFTAKHIGKKATLEMMDYETLRKAVSKLPAIVRQSPGPRLYIQAPSENPVIQAFDYAAFTFSRYPIEKYTDRFNRRYWAMVAIFMPVETAEKLFDFIMREDRDFAIKVYETLFPDFAKHPETPHTLALDPNAVIVKNGTEYSIPK